MCFNCFIPLKLYKKIIVPRQLLTVKFYRMMIKIYFHKSVHKGVCIDMRTYIGMNVSMYDRNAGFHSCLQMI